MKLFFIFFYLISCCLIAQNVTYRIPELLEIPERSSYLLNPAGIERPAEKIAVSSGYKGFTGFRNVLKYAYGTLLYTTGNDSLNKTRHSLGITLLAEREGEFIKRNYIYGLYSLPITLSKKLTLSTGASLGVASYSLAGTGVVAGGTATAPDGKIGITVHRSGLSIGFSSGGIFSTTLTPLYEKNRLSRYYIAHVRCELPLTYGWKLSGIGFVRSSSLQTDVFLGSRLHYHRIFEGGLSVKYQNSLSFLIGLPRIKISETSNLNFYISYSSVFKKVLYGSSDILEINIGYFLD